MPEKNPEKKQCNENLRSRSNSFDNVIHSLLQEAGGVLTSKTVIGEPIEVGDTLLIPLSDVTVGAPAPTTGRIKMPEWAALRQKCLPARFW